MEYAKDEVFQIRYNTKLDRLQLKQENWTSRLWKIVKRHKLLTIAMISLLIFSLINIIMINSFIRILRKHIRLSKSLIANFFWN